MLKISDKNIQKFSGCRSAIQRLQRNGAEETNISPFPADPDHSTEIAFYTAAGCAKGFGNLWIKQFTDAQQIVFIFQA